jgi:transposase
MTAPTRFIGIDIHRQFVMVAAVDGQQHPLLDPIKVPLEAFKTWADTQLRTTDQVALEATTNAWTIYDSLQPLVAEVTVADAHKISLISRSPRKTDQHDAPVLAKLLAANLLPVVWVPPQSVRELRNLIAHRRHLVRDRTATKNRLHSVLHRYNLHLPEGDPFTDANRAWWQALTLSRSEQLRVRHELLHIQHLTQLIEEVEAEIAQLSIQEPWCEELAFLIQLPGVSWLSGMTILSAIGDIARFLGQTIGWV